MRHCHARRLALPLALFSALIMTICLPLCAQDLSSLRVAILDDDIPGLDRELVGLIAASITSHGARVTRLDADSLASDERFDRETHDALILTNSPRFPRKAAANVERFLQSGGHLVLLGGHAYSDPVCRVRGEWTNRDGYAGALAETPTEASLFSFDQGDLSGWRRGTNNAVHRSQAVPAPGVSGQCLRLEIEGLSRWQWDTFGTYLDGPPSAGHDLLLFHARGGEKTPRFVVGVDETDGSRWVCPVDLTPQWRRVALGPDRFRFLKDGSPADRGKAGDRLRLDRAKRVSFGMADGIIDYPPGDHLIEIDEVGTARNDLGVTLADFAAPNSVCFDDYEVHALRDVVRVARWNGVEISPSSPHEISIEGISAVGYTLWDRSRFEPVLVAQDQHRRTRGWALSELVHYDGAYKGGCWLLSGVTTPAFYRSSVFLLRLGGFLADLADRGEASQENAVRRNEEMKQAALELTTPAPGPLTLSADGRQFIGPDGRPFFMIGCNYIGSFDRKFFGGPWVRWLEEDFRKARDAGLNCMRIYGASVLYKDPAKLAALKECARKYGIYLLIVVVDHTDLLTREALEARARECAEAFKYEPMLLGYDLQNEPYTYKLAEISDGKMTLGEKYPLWKRWGEYEQWAGLQIAGNFSSFPGVTGPLPRNDEWGPVLDATDSIFREWITWQVDAIRAVDKTHPITVGYNSVFGCLPCNERLDFVSHHGYQAPKGLDGVQRNLTTLDRLRAVWPDRPISFGEFGYTNGMVLPDGYLDPHTSAVGEFLHWLYAYANDFSGCMKWVLTDHPLELSRQQCKWIPEDDLARHIDQGRFGFYWSDGTFEGRPKPLVSALRFFRDYVDAGGDRGSLVLHPADTRIGAGYVFRAPNALFVGEVRYQSPDLDFTSRDAANVLLWWDGAVLRLVSTADAKARVRLAAFLPESDGEMTVSGSLAGHSRDGEWAELELLEGEEVRLRR